MRKILKKNLIYILVISLFWLIFFPILFLNRNELYNWYSTFISPKGYNPKVMKKFISEGDKLVDASFEDSIQSKRIEELSENPKKREELIKTFLAKMEDSCRFAKESASKDELLSDPNWLERNSEWSDDPDESKNAVGLSRKALPAFTYPENYWKKNIPKLLDSLDYYKRALYYSGPEINAADKIHFIAKAICKENESILAYSSYLNHSISYVSDIIDKEDILFQQKNNTFWNKLKTIFGKENFLERKDTYGLTPLMRKTIILSYIKENHALPVLLDYLRGLNILLLDTNLRNMSPVEADELFEIMLFFLAKTDDPIQIKNEKFFRFKRGIHLFKMGDYFKARDQFLASKEFPNLEEESPVSIRLILAHIFQSELMIAKCHFQIKDYKAAMSSISNLESTLHNVDGRDGGRIDRELLKDYKRTRIEVLKKLGRTREAEEMEE